MLFIIRIYQNILNLFDYYFYVEYQINIKLISFNFIVGF